MTFITPTWLTVAVNMPVACSHMPRDRSTELTGVLRAVGRSVVIATRVMCSIAVRVVLSASNARLGDLQQLEIECVGHCFVSRVSRVKSIA